MNEYQQEQVDSIQQVKVSTNISTKVKNKLNNVTKLAEKWRRGEEIKKQVTKSVEEFKMTKSVED